MFSLLTLLAIVVVLLLVTRCWPMRIWNRLAATDNVFRKGFAQIDVQLQRGWHHFSTWWQPQRSTEPRVRNAGSRQSRRALLRITDWRRPRPIRAIRRTSRWRSELNAGLGRRIGVVEAYPDLRANRP
ncbi:MAG: hypothetical protein ABWX93_02900 [Pseudoxanthomonas sp.]